MGIENELSQICAMIESGKLCYADAVYYLNLMRKKYGIWEKEFRQICDVWSQKGELSGELDRHRDRAEDEADGLYQRVLDGLYEMVELGEITMEMMTENLWEDAYETKKIHAEVMSVFIRSCRAASDMGKIRRCFVRI